ncbi:hypothetical protein OSB04_un001859 [Centaurea solstitialis]|uniref:DUF641 domain-containing protein n=1 Tax=Centaurea solstitialis TaxID=347529 RepID=A0AA38W294_9ASTR|nr:hypothetical protein OSB04_un001859 [Centaurea solstitialis]
MNFTQIKPQLFFLLITQWNWEIISQFKTPTNLRNVSEIRNRIQNQNLRIIAEEDEESAAVSSAAVSDNEDGFTLLDSAEDFITDQKVIIIKPDFKTQCENASSNSSSIIIQPFNTHFGNYLISSVFAVISSFQASYLQLQTAHVPFDQEGIMVNDKSLVNQLQKLYDLRGLYIDSRKNPDFNLISRLGLVWSSRMRIRTSMFQRFDSEDFGLVEDGDSSNDNSMELFDHVSVNPLETLNKNPNCAFSKFCERI